MNHFKCVESEDEKQVLWKFSGDMNENFEMPNFSSNKTLVINLKDILAINSYGIKVWLKWGLKNSFLTEIVLEECPYIFIKNDSLIKGFIASNMRIISLYAPFFSEETQESKQVLFEYGTDYASDGVVRLPKVFDSKGIEMELDVNMATYFSFLKKEK